MHARIKTGGKQYRVEQDNIIEIERCEMKDGVIDFADILLINDGDKTIIDKSGLLDYSVKGELVKEVSGPKVSSVKYIPGNHCKKFGHRQKLFRVKITEIGKKEHHKKHHEHKKHHGHQEATHGA